MLSIYLNHRGANTVNLLRTSLGLMLPIYLELPGANAVNLLKPLRG